MALSIIMPALSPTMEKGTLAKWLVAEGDSVRAGDLIAEIETDKATMEMEAVEDGRIASLIIANGTEGVAVGTVIALMAADDDEAPQPTRGQPVDDKPVAAKSLVAATPPAAAAAVAPPVPDRAPSLDDGAHATPLVKRIAAIKGLDLASIKGSGPRGKIVRQDLGLTPPVAPAPAQPVESAPSTPIIAPPPQGVPVETVKLSTMRKTIARRLTEAKQQVPHFYLTARCNIDALLKLRGELNATLADRGIKISVNDMLMKALSKALIAVPDANVQFGGDVLHRFGRVDIAMAVAIDGGLITPVIRGVDTLSLSTIAQTARDLASKARDGKLLPEDYLGGTVSISNLGMFGIDEMFPVINPPQALILGAAAGVRQPWNVDGEMALATIMAATASFDHRAIDGAVGAQFMAALRELLETPMMIVS